jgi:c-di-GMP-binding flagellar brake protein YcgR
MLEKLSALTRHISNDRRVKRRHHIVYDTLIRDAQGNALFRGKTVNISTTGAKITGFPTNMDMERNQTVRVEFLVLPEDCTQSAKRKPINARVVRIEEKEDDFLVAVRFERTEHFN